MIALIISSSRRISSVLKRETINPEQLQKIITTAIQQMSIKTIKMKTEL